MARFEVGLGVEVEVVEVPGGGEPGEAFEAGLAAGLGGRHLDVEEPFEERAVAELVLEGVVELAGERLGGRSEAQVGEMRAQLLVDGVVAHDRASTPRRGPMTSTRRW
jgi:hypothetical protein